MSGEQETVLLYLFSPSPPILIFPRLSPSLSLSLARSLSTFKSHPTNAPNSHSICLRRSYFLCVFGLLFKCLKDFHSHFTRTWVVSAAILPFTSLSGFMVSVPTLTSDRSLTVSPNMYEKVVPVPYSCSAGRFIWLRQEMCIGTEILRQKAEMRCEVFMDKENPYISSIYSSISTLSF